VSVRERDVTQWLHAKGALYARSGQHQKGLAYLLMANRIAPDDINVLRSLAGVFTGHGDGQRALSAIGRLSQLEGPTLSQQLLRCRALWVMGDHVEARRCFRDYLQSTRDAATEQPDHRSSP